MEVEPAVHEPIEHEHDDEDAVPNGEEQSNDDGQADEDEEQDDDGEENGLLGEDFGEEESDDMLGQYPKLGEERFELHRAIEDHADVTALLSAQSTSLDERDHWGQVRVHTSMSTGANGHIRRRR